MRLIFITLSVSAALLAGCGHSAKQKSYSREFKPVNNAQLLPIHFYLITKSRNTPLSLINDSLSSADSANESKKPLSDYEIMTLRQALPEDTSEFAPKYPNPFCPSYSSSFTVTETDKFSIEIYNLKGELVGFILDQELLSPGRYEFKWYGLMPDGSLQPSGIYFYRISNSKGAIETRKMILL